MKISHIIITAVLCAISYWFGLNQREVIETTHVEVNEQSWGEQLPISVEPVVDVDAPKFKVARLLLVPQPPMVGGLGGSSSEGLCDSVSAEIPLHLYNFEDPRGRWSCQVEGYAVNRLLNMTIRDSVVHTTTTAVALPKWEINALAGINNHAQWLGLEYRRHFGALHLSAIGGYDLVNSKPYIEARAGLRLLKK